MTPYPPGESTTEDVLGKVDVLRYVVGFGVYYSFQTLPTFFMPLTISLFPLAHMPGETPLSLYSTATQNFSCWWVCVGYTNMLVSKNGKICVIPNANANANICITPALPPAKPNTSRWNVGCVVLRLLALGLALGLYISCCLRQFSVEYVQTLQ